MSISVNLYVILQIKENCKTLTMRNDRRTKYTKMVIRDAFLALIKKKPIQKITVADICALAEISRPTFYFHYEDIYALLDEIGNNMLASSNLDEMTQLTIDDQDEIDQVILNLVHIIENNIDVCRICVLERGVATRIPNRIAEELNRTIVKKWTEQGMLRCKVDQSYFVEYLQASFNSVIRCWIGRKENRESAEEVAAIIKTLLLNGLLGFAK